MSEAMNNKYQLILKYPASWWKNMWRDALPAGNGLIGASVYGAVHEETVLINHAELWHGGRRDELPDVSHTLQETRKLMDEGRYREASWHLSETLKQTGYATRLASPVPLVDLKLSMQVNQAFRRYRRSLNMETGEITVAWMDGPVHYQRKLFVSRDDDLIVYRIESDHPAMEGFVRFSFHPSDNPKLSEALRERKEHAGSVAEDSFVCYSARNEDGLDYGAVLRVISEAGEVIPENNGLRISQTSEVLILIKVFANSEREREWARLKRDLLAENRNYDQLLAEHKTHYQPLFFSATLDLGNHDGGRTNEELLLESYDGEASTELIEKLWAYGRYLYISATREQGPPMPLYGLWGGDYRLMWCHYMANENIQMMNWHAPVGGLVSLTKAMFHHYNRLMDDFRENARKLYGCRGIYIPAGTTPGIGVPNQIVPVIMNWTGAAGWLARHYFDYYLFTGDTEFLRKTALPFMREAALFYEDFLVKDESGFYHIYPSVSPENTPGNFMPEDTGQQLDHPMPTARNATMDIAIIKELLTNLIQGCRVTGMYEDDLDRWEEMLEHLPPYQMNEDGAVKEWTHPAFHDRYDHRHLSHLYPIFPGQEFIKEEQPELFTAFEQAVHLRNIGAQTGWSLAHMASIYARLGNGEKALEALDILARSCLINNFFTVHNDWRNMGASMNKAQAPVQLDANLGITNAVQEMLITVTGRVVKLMAAVPSRWKQGRVKGLRFHTGSVSFAWDRTSSRFEAEIQALRKTAVTIVLPEEFAEYQWSGPEGSWQASASDRNVCLIRLSPGQKLYIQNQGKG